MLWSEIAWIVAPRTALVFSRTSRPTNTRDRTTPTAAIPCWTFVERSDMLHDPAWSGIEELSCGPGFRCRA